MNIGRDRVCLVYFLMMGHLVNVGQLMPHHMAHVRGSNRVDKIFFGNMLTQYLRSEAVDEEPGFDMIILAAL